MSTGKIGVTTENIFPVIKKFLYSDHEIFLRELVSNAVDATQKLRTLSSFGEFKGEIGKTDVVVSIDKEKKTLTVSDNGIGMTADDIEKYINQIAFSGAEEFLEKYKDTANSIIGHFGLGFYSAFMVADKVEINSLSYREGAEAVHWECDGSPEYTMEKGTRTTRGTDIVLHIDNDSAEFLEQIRIDTLLKKYCRFLPVPVYSGETLVNALEPMWMKKPADLTDEDYIKFYHELHPGQDDPLFWIHLNVDYPFTLTGILYFPKIHNNFEINKNRIQLYCNQVFVTDSVEGVVPEFMMLMQGVIDSPDIPLNVSRSYLQADSAVKQISSYITRKVASRLDDLFKADRKNFETKWPDIRIFIEYGMLTDEKFCEAAMKFTLLEDTNHKFFTLDEYKALVEPEQTDKDGNIVYLYTTDPVGQYNYIKAANDRGYNVLLMDGQLDNHFVQLLESKFEKTVFTRVDADIVDHLIRKDSSRSVDLTPTQVNILSSLFQAAVPNDNKMMFTVTFEALAPGDMPVVITQNEYMRRMRDMAAMQPGRNFYAEMPEYYTLVVNTAAPVVEKIRDAATEALAAKVEPFEKEIEANNARIDELRKQANGEKLSDEAQKESDAAYDAVGKARAATEAIVKEYAASQPLVGQIIDLALLGNGLLKGKGLSDFIARSVSLL